MQKLKTIAQKKLHKYLYGSAYSRAFFTLLGVSVKELQCTFGQFYTLKYPVRSLIRLLGIYNSALARIVLGRALKFSFAFTGEDRIIEGLIKPLIYQPGFYVDVGCNHPVFLSNTYGLYRKGWRGICVDANPLLVAKYAYYRPKDSAVNALLAEKQQSATFYEVENDVLSTLEVANLETISQAGLAYKARQVTTTTLTQVLAANKCPHNFDILSIDAEEYDYKILEGLDLSLYQPKLIIVEDEAFSFETYVQNSFVKLLGKHGYQLKGFVLKNAYFMKIQPT